MRTILIKLSILLLFSIRLVAQDTIIRNKTNLEVKTNEFIDTRDGQSYPIIVIGEQTWMARNLSYKPDTGKYWIPDENFENISKYGYLYNYVSLSNVCPSGWHLPEKEEFDILVNNELVKKQNKNLMEFGLSGFNALLCGFHDKINLIPSGNWTIFWTAPEKENKKIWMMQVGTLYPEVQFFELPKKKKDGNSVRCIKNK